MTWFVVQLNGAPYTLLICEDCGGQNFGRVRGFSTVMSACWDCFEDSGRYRMGNHQCPLCESKCSLVLPPNTASVMLAVCSECHWTGIPSVVSYVEGK